MNPRSQLLELSRHTLPDGCEFATGSIPTGLRLGAERSEELWRMHPAEYAVKPVYGKPKPMPRWEQAYGREYRFSGSLSPALPVPELLAPYLEWSKKAIDERLNGLFVNWYDGSLGHYIGPHRDDDKRLITGTPIVTISFGERRVLRFRPFRGEGFVDFPAVDGGVFVIPLATNRRWKHEVPKTAKARGRRVSVTIRAFDATVPAV